MESPFGDVIMCRVVYVMDKVSFSIMYLSPHCLRQLFLGKVGKEHKREDEKC